MVPEEYVATPPTVPANVPEFKTKLTAGTDAYEIEIEDKKKKILKIREDNNFLKVFIHTLKYKQIKYLCQTKTKIVDIQEVYMYTLTYEHI